MSPVGFSKKAKRILGVLVVNSVTKVTRKIKEEKRTILFKVLKLSFVKFLLYKRKFLLYYIIADEIVNRTQLRDTI